MLYFHSEHVRVEKLYGDIKRNKRSTSLTFPLELGFRLRLRSGDVKLDLERSVLPGKVTPLYVLEKDMKVILHSNRVQVGTLIFITE